MTTYTAEDFERAEFARHPNGGSAMRVMRARLSTGPHMVWVDYDSMGEYRYRTDGYMASAGWVPVQQPRPLTVDDAMVQRAADILDDAEFNTYPTGHVAIRDIRKVARRALAAALPEPKRPEGAEEIEAALRDEWTFEDDGEFVDLAARLARRGVRVTGDQS